MLPFVNELPYLHYLTLWQKVQISFFIFTLSYFLIMFGAKPKNRRAARLFTEDVKGKFMTTCGFFGAIFFGALFSGNIMGLLVLHTLPTQPYLNHVLVDEMKYQGSKHKSILLTLHSEADGKTYYLTLAKKLFDYPRIEAGNKMILKGQQNVFGIYVEQFEMDY
ncbi:hypothetical protein [Methylotenera sp. N17]|uniref:hypothetical protein n=1 Tax=Methylotenera sp. N17 TaxID=1502761 RepID=UPI0013621B6F|nr:hypothetical protein [Methylotenera sp. N17]